MQQIDADSVKVIIDTNALMTAEQFGVDIFSELLRLGYIEWLVPAQVRGEVRSLADGAEKEGAAVFTNDRALKKRLFSKGITVIYLRQGRYLEAMKKEY